MRKTAALLSMLTVLISLTACSAAVNASTVLVPIAKTALMITVGGLSSEVSQMAAHGEVNRQEVANTALFFGAAEVANMAFTGAFNPNVSNTFSSSGYNGSVSVVDDVVGSEALLWMERY